MRGAIRTLGLAIIAQALSIAVSLAQTVGIATLQAGSGNNLQAQVMAKIVQSHTDLQVRVIPLAGTTANLGAIQSGDSEFTIGNADNMVDAVYATGEFSRLKKMSDLRIAFRLMDFPIGIMVRNDSPIRTLEQLKGKKFPVGWRAFPNGIPLCNGVLASAGLSMEDTDGVVTSGLIPAADDFKSGKTDATCIALEAPKVREVNAAFSDGVRFLSMNNTPEALARVRKVRPVYGIMTIAPGPRFVGVLTPTNALQAPVLVMTGAKVKDEIVYKLVKALTENKSELIAGHPSFNSFFPDQRMAEQFETVEYHPGAIKYLKEKGYWQGR